MNGSCISAAIALLVVLALADVAQTTPSRNLIPNPGFERGLWGWRTQGAADFRSDAEVRHGGKRSARITIRAEDKLEYQRIWRAFPVKAGEAIRMRFWTRCTGQSDGSGAYGALQFVDGEQQIGIVHTDILSNRMRPNQWYRLEAWAVVPQGATSVRFLCVLHSRGTAWFDDAELTRMEDAPGPDHAAVRLTLKPDKVITDRWQGFGVQGDLFLGLQRTIRHGITDEDRALVRRRILAMRPKLVRLAVNLIDWEAERGKQTPENEGIRDLRETLAIYKEAGADVQLTEWGHRLPDWCRAEGQLPHPDERRAFTDSWAALLKYLREDCGFTNVRYVTLYNEPNRLDWEGYAAVYRALDSSLRDAGLRQQVSIIGPDEACENQLLPRAVNELDDVIDYYDAHNYTSNNGREFALWVRPRIELMPKPKKRSMVPARKRFLITEFGMAEGMDTWSTPHNHEYGYGIFLADSAIVSCIEGVSGMAMWCLMDTDYGQMMKWGLWRFRDEGWEPRPGFYAWSLITRYTELGSTVHPLASDSASVVSVAFRGPGRGPWTLTAVNRMESDRPLTIAGLRAGSRWQSFVYSEDTVPTADREMIGAGPTLTADARGAIRAELPSRSFVLWHEVAQSRS